MELLVGNTESTCISTIKRGFPQTKPCNPQSTKVYPLNFQVTNKSCDKIFTMEYLEIVNWELERSIIIFVTTQELEHDDFL